MRLSWKTTERLVRSNSPAIFTGVAVVGTITTAMLSARAQTNVDRLRLEMGGYDDRWQQLQAEAPIYAPAISSGVLTVGCIVAIHRIGTRRTAAMAAAYAISERTFDQYRRTVSDRLGDKGAQAVHDAVQQRIVDGDPVGAKTVYVTGVEEVLCYEAFTGRYFKSSVESINAAVNKVNFQMLHDGMASLSDFYDEVGLPHTGASDDLGWNTTMCEIEFSTTLAEGKTPCVVITYRTEPLNGYHKFH